MPKISVGGVTFKTGEVVLYENLKGVISKHKVMGKSAHVPPGLILEDVSTKTTFAISAASVATKVTKIPATVSPPTISPPFGGGGPGPGGPAGGGGPPVGGGGYPRGYPGGYGGPPVGGGPGPGGPPGGMPRSPGRWRRFWGKLKPIGGKIGNFHDSMGGSSRVGLEFLIALAIAVHVADAFWLNFSMNAIDIGYRIFMYFILCIVAHVILNKGWSTGESMLELFKVSAIPLFVIPFISVILGWLSVPDKAVELISALSLAFPIWIFYILYMRDGKVEVEGSFWKKAVNLLFTPSGWARIWFFILVIAVMYNLVMLMGLSVSNIPGAEVSGFDVQTSIEGLTTFFTATFEKMSTSVVGFIKVITRGVETYRNDTLGYYTGTVEDNKGEQTGIFITSFKVNGKQYESIPTMAYGYIRAKSFVDGVNIDVSCYAQSTTNKSIIYEVEANPKTLNNIKIEDQRGVVCKFENIDGNRGLPAGRYQMFIVLKFNFETWAYKPYYFADSDYLVYLRTNGEDPNTKMKIPLKTKTIYTNGPLMIGMDDKLEMPLALSSQDENYLPLGMTLDNKQLLYGVKGEVLKVNKYTLRLPESIEIDTSACTIGSGDISNEPDAIAGYRLYTFNIPSDSLAGTYMTINCNLKIQKDSVQKIIPGANTAAMITIVGTAVYDYKLSKMISVTVEKNPGS